MNVHESEKIDAQLSAAGFERAENEVTSDITVFNTCCIRNTAEQKIISHIGETKRTNKIVCVVGCLAQREGSAAALKRKFPHIAVILGTHNIGRLADKLKIHIVNRNKLTEVLPERIENDCLANTSSHENTAYINITYGCENFCSYCIVPYVRGKLISRDCKLIIQEFRNRLGGSPASIMLLGQNVNSYVCPKTGMDFPALLETLCREVAPNIKTQITFMSSHPKDFSDRLICVIAANPQISRSVHLPIQSGCDKILKLMNRKYTVAEYEAKIAKLRKKVPGVSITSDIIAGFPGETEADFAETKATLQRIRFNAAFIFPYSRRTGTLADKMPYQIDAKTKKARATELINLQRGISKNNIN